MNKLSKKLLTAAGVIAIFIVIGIAGRVDYAEQVIYNMPDSAYEKITSKMPDASDYEIAREYIENKDYYNSLQY